MSKEPLKRLAINSPGYTAASVFYCSLRAVSDLMTCVIKSEKVCCPYFNLGE